MASNFEQLDDDERQRFFLRKKTLISALNESLNSFDGQLSDQEILNLTWNLQIVKSRSRMASAYEFLKHGNPKSVQKF